MRIASLGGEISHVLVDPGKDLHGPPTRPLNPKPRSPWRPRADWSKHVDRSYPITCDGYPITSFLGGFTGVFVYRYGIQVCTYGYSVAPRNSRGHGAFDWLNVSQRGDSPMDLLITSRTGSSPLFARPRMESYGFDPPPKSARFLQK